MMPAKAGNLMTGRTRFALLAALALAFSSALSGHQSPQQTTPLFRSGVDLVEVDVAVTDKDGKAILGLSKDDFVVKNHSIASFQEVSRELSTDPVEREMRALPRDVADNQSAQDVTLIALVLDDRIYPEDLATSKTIAHHLVDQLGPGSEVGLLMASGRQAVRDHRQSSAADYAIDRLEVDPVRRILRTSAADIAPCSFEMLEQVARQLAPQRASRKAVVAITPFCGTDVTGAIGPLPDALITFKNSPQRAWWTRCAAPMWRSSRSIHEVPWTSATPISDWTEGETSPRDVLKWIRGRSILARRRRQIWS